MALERMQPGLILGFSTLGCYSSIPQPAVQAGGRDKVLTAMMRSKRGSHASSSLRAHPVHQPPPPARDAQEAHPTQVVDSLVRHPFCRWEGWAVLATPTPRQGRVALPYDDCMLPCRATGTPPDQAVGCTGIETSQDSLCRLPPGEDGWDGRPNHDTARRRFVGAAWG